jgi:hypothetical protein
MGGDYDGRRSTGEVIAGHLRRRQNSDLTATGDYRYRQRLTDGTGGSPPRPSTIRPLRWMIIRATDPRRVHAGKRWCTSDPWRRPCRRGGPPATS